MEQRRARSGSSRYAGCFRTDFDFKAKFPRLLPTVQYIAACSPHTKITRYHGSEYCSIELIGGIEMGMRVGLGENRVERAGWIPPYLDDATRTTMTLTHFSPSRITRPR
jgi:hypothetical protein